MKTIVKKILLTLSAVMLFTVLVCFNASARELSENGVFSENLTWSYDDSTGTVTIGGTGKMEGYQAVDYVSPFYENLNIKNVIIEDGVTTIGAYAFVGCKGVESVIISDSVESIDAFAFSGCSSLESVTIGKGVSEIGCEAFKGCRNIKKVYISDVSSWCKIDFSEDFDFNSATVSSNPLSVSRGAQFYLNDTLVTEVIIPEEVTSVSRYLFGNITSIEKITVFNRNLDISTFPSSAVIWCYKNSNAHNYCVENNIRFVLIDGTVEENTVSGAFGKFSWKLDKRTGVLEINGSGALPDFGSTGAPWKEYNNYILKIVFSEGFTDIGTGFSSYPLLRSVEIPDTVTSITRAFVLCTSISSVTIPDSVTSIGEKAFYGCTSLSSVTIPNSVTSIGEEAFCGCTSLSSVTIPDSVTSIGYCAFAGCTSLSSITIPDGVSIIGYRAFYGCTSLSSVTIPDSVTSIVEGAFENCTGLAELTIPFSVKSIGSKTFASTLKELMIYSTDCEFAKDCGLNYTHTIYGFKGSTAESFADEIGATFINIETVHTHKAVVIPGKDATCTETGLTEGKRCTDCGVEFVKQEEIPLADHKEETIEGKAATCTKAGISDGKKCTVCDTVTVEQEEIPALGHKETTIKAVKATYTKTGLTAGKKCKTCGKVTVKQKTVAKKKLKKVIVSSVKSTKKKLATVTWKKTTDASGYIVEYSTSKKFTKKTTKKVTIKKGKTTKTTLKKLKSGKKYYVRVKAYRTEGKKTVYGSYSSVKTVKIK